MTTCISCSNYFIWDDIYGEKHEYCVCPELKLKDDEIPKNTSVLTGIEIYLYIRMRYRPIKELITPCKCYIKHG